MATPVFINQFRLYGTQSADNFGVEIAGPKNMPLDGWKVAVYVGETGAFIGETAFPAAETIGTNGVRYLKTPAAHQHYSAAVALIDPAGVVIQFLTVWGDSTGTRTRPAATTGPAAGLSPVWIGRYTVSTNTSHSFYLQGTGATYEAFTWHDLATALGWNAPNSGQTLTMGDWTPPAPEPEPEPEPDPDPDPDPDPTPDPAPTPGAALAGRVVAFMGRTGDEAFEALAVQHVEIVAQMVNAYIRGNYAANAATALADVPDLAAVIVSASARLLANPAQFTAESSDGFSARGRFEGFSLGEQAVLHRYRRRSA